VAKPMLDAKGAGRGNRLISIDSYRNTTAKFATDVVTVQGDSCLALLAALAARLEVKPMVSLANELGAEKLAQLHGVEAGLSDGIADAVKGAKSPAFVISPSAGGSAYWREIAAMCGLIATSAGGSLLPLTVYGNARGAHATAARLGLGGVEDLVGALSRGDFKVLLVLGADLAASLPDEKLCTALNGLEYLAVGSPLPNETAAMADITLPSAFWFEEDGTVFSVDGAQHASPAVAAPPKGALTNREFFLNLASALGTPIEDNVTAPGSLDDAPGQSADELVKSAGAALNEMGGSREIDGELLFGISDCTHFWDGSLTRQAKWPALTKRQPVLVISEESGKRRGLRTDQKVKVSTDYGSIEVPVEIRGEVKGKTALISSHFAACRKLFGWASRNGGVATGPVAASVTPAD